MSFQKTKTIVLAAEIILIIFIALTNIAAYAVGNAAEDQFRTGMEYFNEADYEHAFSYFLISGEIKGYAPSQNMLGICYRNGLGTEQDNSKAEEFFEKAAEQGNSDAAANLAAMREEKDFQKTLPIPTITSVTLDDQNHPVITWEAVPGAKNYKIISSEDNITFGNPIYSNSTSITRYNRYDEGKTYYFKICAVFLEGKVSEYSESGSIKISKKLDAPRIISITLDSNAHPKIEWTKVDGASAYEIFVSKTGETYSRLAYAIKTTEYTVISNKPGTTYYYKVRAIAADKTEGKYSSPRSIFIPTTFTPTSASATKAVSFQKLETEQDFVMWKEGIQDEVLTSIVIPENPASPYGKALRENLINGVFYSDAQKVNIVTDTFFGRKDNNGTHRSWYYGTYRDDIYPNYRVELYYADGMLFFANITKNSKTCVTLHYWGNKLIACRDFRANYDDVSYEGSTIYDSVNAEFGNIYSVAQLYAP